MSLPTKKITKLLKMFLVNQKYFVQFALNVSQRTLGLCQTSDAENFTGLLLLNTVLMLDGILKLSLHLPSIDFN